MNLGTYVITDPHLSTLSHAEQARLATAGGADVVQLRDKHAGGRELVRAGIAIREVVPDDRLFIVNDRVDVAYAVGADGVHLGQDDLPISYARRILGEDAVIGISASNMEEAIHAEQEGADYIGLQSIFSTSTKLDVGDAIGLEAITEVKKNVNIPVVAIGGINHQNAAEVIWAGADGVAVISAVIGSPEPELATRQLREIVIRCKDSVIK